ncbi:MAG: type IV pilus assembly protein PilM [Patescibacteria group bacterium]|jgi:type IV pilus assembly protein PilM
MALFSKENSYLGVDIGAHNIKLVELEDQRGRPRLLTYGYTDQIVSSDVPDLLENVDETVLIIKELIKKAKVKSKKVVAALPVSSIFSSVISLSNIKADSPKDLEDAIKWQAKKVIPMPLEEMILYHNVLKKAEEKVDGRALVQRFLLTAAPRNLVKIYLDIFKKAGLQIISLETESFALSRSLIGSDKSAVMVVDMGEATTNISVVRDGVPLLNRSIDTAGQSFTKIFSKNLGLDNLTAERFKRDLSGLTAQSEIAAIKELFDNLVHEINYCFNLYQQESNMIDGKIEKIILTGGSALLPNLDKYLSQNLNVKAFLGDPWARIVYPQDLQPILDKIGPRLSIAIGLAMREIS